MKKFRGGSHPLGEPGFPIGAIFAAVQKKSVGELELPQLVSTAKQLVLSYCHKSAINTCMISVFIFSAAPNDGKELQVPKKHCFPFSLLIDDESRLWT